MPLVMLVLAPSLKIVPVRFAPDRFPALNRVTLVLPSGAIKTTLRFARIGSVILSPTVKLPTVA